MATFAIQATSATFIDCGDYQMVRVAMRATSLHLEAFEAVSLDRLRIAYDAARSKLDAARAPYSLNVRLVEGRAPRGWKEAKASFRHDESFGIFEAC